MNNEPAGSWYRLTLPNGHVRFEYQATEPIQRVMQTWNVDGFSFEPVVVMTRVEHEALQAMINERVQRVAQLYQRIAELKTEAEMLLAERDKAEQELAASNSLVKATEEALQRSIGEGKELHAVARALYAALETVLEHGDVRADTDKYQHEAYHKATNALTEYSEWKGDDDA